MPSILQDTQVDTAKPTDAAECLGEEHTDFDPTELAGYLSYCSYSTDCVNTSQYCCYYNNLCEYTNDCYNDTNTGTHIVFWAWFGPSLACFWITLCCIICCCRRRRQRVILVQQQAPQQNAVTVVTANNIIAPQPQPVYQPIP